MLDFEEYRQIRKDYFGDQFQAHYKYYFEYKPAMEKKMNCDKIWIDDCVPCKNWLAPLPQAVPVEPKKNFFKAKCKQEEGNKPMRYNDNYASATVVTATKTDAATQREYFLSRLGEAKYPIQSKMEKHFNLHVTPGPTNFEELIDMVKNDKFKISKKAQAKLDDVKEKAAEDGDTPYWGYGSTYGIEWDGPKADYKGYELAIADIEKQQTLARDTIMSGDAAAMAKAVADFEAWTPVGNAN